MRPLSLLPDLLGDVVKPGGVHPPGCGEGAVRFQRHSVRRHLPPPYNLQVTANIQGEYARPCQHTRWVKEI